MTYTREKLQPLQITKNSPSELGGIIQVLADKVFANEEIR